ncbi:hypothetical protein D3C84_968360 [compost metagenome]
MVQTPVSSSTWMGISGAWVVMCSVLQNSVGYLGRLLAGLMGIAALNPSYEGVRRVFRRVG